MKLVKVIAVFLVVLSVLLTLSSCGEVEDFEKNDNTYVVTTKVKETVSYTQSHFEVLNVRMGMSCAEVQIAAGDLGTLNQGENGQIYFVVERQDLPFITPGFPAGVFYIFDANMRLCQVQYLSSTNIGFKFNEAIAKFDNDYGRHAVNHVDTRRDNYIWFKDDVYIVLTYSNDGQGIISFFSEEYFESRYKKDTEVYKNLG